LLPPGYEEGQRVPVIVDLDGDGAGNRLNYFGLGKEYGQILASRGYALFFPGLPLERSDPMRQLPGLALPAVNQLIELGIADPDRLGLIGEGYGGYLTLALLTQTRMFRAAVTIAGMVNLTSAYGALTDYGESFGVSNFEDEYGQGRMGASLWDQRERFIENSPLFYLDRVHTPVLLVAGREHWEDPSQAKQAFSALRRLEKQVELRLYHKDGHSIGKRENKQDLYDRIPDWFDTYLKPL
jgi:dipeptidyl aminopeptidase/acylaminoacyl peptidase